MVSGYLPPEMIRFTISLDIFCDFYHFVLFLRLFYFVVSAHGNCSSESNNNVRAKSG